MPNKKKPDNYWSLLEPTFEAVDIYRGSRIFLAQYRKLRPEVGHLLASHWCQSEICNGGLYQFFHNSTGVLAPEALEGFKAMNITVGAEVLAEAVQYFDPQYPRGRSERQRRLPCPAPGQKRSDWDPFHALDDRFYAWINGKGAPWQAMADAYARKAQDA